MRHCDVETRVIDEDACTIMQYTYSGKADSRDEGAVLDLLGELGFKTFARFCIAAFLLFFLNPFYDLGALVFQCLRVKIASN